MLGQPGGEKSDDMFSISIQYTCVTDKETYILWQHSPRYAYA